LVKSVRHFDEEESRPRIDDLSIMSMEDIKMRGEQTNQKELEAKLKIV
jgi:hypothetical protein